MTLLTCGKGSIVKISVQPFSQGAVFPGNIFHLNVIYVRLKKIFRDNKSFIILYLKNTPFNRLGTGICFLLIITEHDVIAY